MMARLIMRLVRNTGRGLALQEALYGFIMAMLFISAAAFGLIPVNSNTEMIILIVGMDFTWGVIDMIIFFFVDVSEQRKHLRILRDEEELYADKRKVIKDNLSGTMVGLLDEEDEEKVIDIICEAKLESLRDIRSDRVDMFKSAFSSFLITFMAVIPSVIVFLVIPDLDDALMIAGFVSSIFLFIIGYRLGPYFGTKGWISGLIVLSLALGITLCATFTGG